MDQAISAVFFFFGGGGGGGGPRVPNTNGNTVLHLYMERVFTFIDNVIQLSIL